MNKTALVTLWVDPVEHQIVKYTFDNVWMDFLPAGWFVKVDDIHASMTMGQPFPGIWLPREMNIHAGVTMAMGSLEAAYARRFSDYKQADVKSLIRIPKPPDKAPDLPPTLCPRTRRRRRAVRSLRPELDSSEARPAGGSHRRDPHTRQRLRARRRGHQARRHQRRAAPARRRLARHRTAAQGERALRIRRGSQALSLAREHDRHRAHPPRSRAPGLHVGNHRRASIGVGLGAGEEPADVPADSRLRRWLWVHVWRAREHDRSAGRGRAIVGAADVGRNAPGGARVRAHVRQGAAHPHRIHVRHLAAREPALRARRSAGRVDGARRTQLRRPRAHGRRNLAEHGRVRSDRRPAVDPRRECRARHARRPGVSAQRRHARRGLDRPARPQPRPTRSTSTRPRRGDISASSARPCSPAACSTRRRIGRSPTTSGCSSAAPRTCAGSAPARSTATGCSCRRPSCACRSPRS